MKRSTLAEVIGTFVLVFAGTGAIVVDEISGGRVTHVGVALSFGLAVMVMVFAVGDVSGAHLNPAVSLGLAASGRMRWIELPAYVAAQVTGALLASALLRAMFSTSTTLGATIPVGGVAQSFVMETVLTFFLVMTVLAVCADPARSRLVAPLAVGGVVALDALVGGPVSGASMNPARSLAPALVSGRLEHLWLYAAAPALGSLAAVVSSRALRQSVPVPTTGQLSGSASPGRSVPARRSSGE